MKNKVAFISKFRYLVLAAFSCLTMGVQCEDDYAEPEYRYIIQETLSLTPFKKTYTAWATQSGLKQTFPPVKYLYDSKKFQRVLIDSVSLPLNLSYYNLYKNPSVVTGGLVKALYADPVERRNEHLSFAYGCNQPDYNFKVGLVLLTPGIYSLNIHDQNFFSNCVTNSASSYSRIFYKFDLADTNKDIFLSIPPISRGGLNTNQMDAREEFVVQVVI